jgi:uncharacterized protein (DUF1330 family)
MPAFMVVIARVKDRARFLEAYGRPQAELAAKWGAKYLVRAPGALCLEGGGGDGASIVVSEWPDKETVLRFWASEDYAPLKAARRALADVEVYVVEQPG